MKGADSLTSLQCSSINILPDLNNPEYLLRTTIMTNINTSGSPLVSVIIPFFNDSEWLIEALQSVINQSCSAWEAIVIDDGSETRHSKIAKEFCTRYPAQIKYVDHENHVNRGVTISRNFGVAHSSGSYLAFLDADDKWFCDKLKHQVDLFDKFPAAQMICEASKFWYSWNNAAEDDTIIPIGVSPDTLYPPRSLTKLLYPLGDGAPPCPSGIIIRKPAFERIGGFEPAFSGVFTLYEDQGFLAKVYLKETVFVSGTANNLYRKRADSMSSAVNDITIYETVRKFFLNWLKKYLSVQNIRDGEIDLLIKNAFEKMGQDSSPG